MIFLRLFCGCLLQLAPFAFLSLYPFNKHFRLPVKQVLCIVLGLIAGLGIIFASVCISLQSVMPPNHDLFVAANNVFMLCLVPCFIFYLVIVKESFLCSFLR